MLLDDGLRALYLAAAALCAASCVATAPEEADRETPAVQEEREPVGAARGLFPAGARISALLRDHGHVDLFVVGHDGRVYTSDSGPLISWSNDADDWTPIGGDFRPGAAVTALARKPGQTDLFVMGSDGRVYTASRTPASGWPGADDAWTPIGGDFPAAATILALSTDPDQIDLFATGSDGRVYTATWTPASGWPGAEDAWTPL